MSMTRIEARRELLRQIHGLVLDLEGGLRPAELRGTGPAAKPENAEPFWQGTLGLLADLKEELVKREISLFKGSVVDKAGFLDAVSHTIGEFKHYIEEAGGWWVLWEHTKDDKPVEHLTERAPQLFFYCIAMAICDPLGILVTRELDVGRGRPDFEFSFGREHRYIVEVKLADNSDLWHNLSEQLPIYLASRRVTQGCYLVVFFDKVDREKKWAEIEERVRKVKVDKGLDLEAYAVDANPKPSASRVRRRKGK